MKMIQKNGYSLILLFFFLTSTIESAFAQKTKVDDMENLSRFMDSIVEKRFYKDEKKDIYLLVMCKVDSTGQILSAHIINSQNLKEELQYIYTISLAIEEKLVAKFMYDLLRSKNSVKTLYYHGTFPYRNNRQNIISYSNMENAWIYWDKNNYNKNI